MNKSIVEELSVSLLIPFSFTLFFSTTNLKSTEKFDNSYDPYRAVVLKDSDHKWNIEKGYKINFSVKGAAGTFSGLTGTILFDEEHLNTSQFDVSVEVASILTGNKTKDKHARGEKWLDALSFPKISFVSSSITENGNGYEVTGFLDLRGVKKEISFAFAFTKNGEEGVFEGSFTLNREDYGIEGPFMAFMVGDEVKVNLKIPVRR